MLELLILVGLVVVGVLTLAKVSKQEKRIQDLEKKQGEAEK